eukprot:c55396_g1_i1 orf=229-396(-)
MVHSGVQIQVYAWVMLRLVMFFFLFLHSLAAVARATSIGFGQLLNTLRLAQISNC